MATPTEVGGRYRLDRRLGAGGMSTVFLAIDTVLERPVAVKLLAEHLAEDEVFVQRFRNEALSAARLQHPNVVQVYDSGLDAESHRHFIVMEYVEGPSTADLLREQRQLDIERTVEILVDACKGLDYAHQSGVIHRDVKPGNLLVVAQTGTVKLADFGIAKAAELARVTQVGSVLGTAAYLSPEQARGEEADAASDIYSMGVCAYQFLTGRLPFEYGSLTELALKQQNEEVEPITRLRPEVPRELDLAVCQCLNRNPGNRYSSALELAAALEAGLHGDSTEATQRLAMASSAEEDEPPTQALPARPRAQAAPARRREARTAAPPARARSAPPARRRRSPWGAIFAVLAVLLAGAAVALAVVSASDSGGNDAPSGDNVGELVQDLKSYIEDHTE